MRRASRFAVVTSLLLLATQGFAACGSSASKGVGGEGRDDEGLQMCCELGAICHEAGPQDSDKAECHEIGHSNNPSDCRVNYEHCVEVCGHSGEGGQGGEPEAHACVSGDD
jgi:hypothetical protein